MALKSGHRVYPLSGEEQQKQVDEFRGYGVGTIRLQPDGWFLTTPFIEDADRIFDFKFRPSDVIIMTYPKCGTTWAQEILWCLMKNPDLNHPFAAVPLASRSPFLEFDFISKATNVIPGDAVRNLSNLFVQVYPDANLEERSCIGMAEKMPDRRLIKTHLPFSLLAKNVQDICKVVYVARNPKDVCVSYHHHAKLLKVMGYTGTLDSFVDHFVNDTMLYSPYWTHFKEAWELRNHPNVHFCYYEDMQTDALAEVMKFQDFIGTNLTKEQIEAIVEYTNYPVMKARFEGMSGGKPSPYLDQKTIKESGGFFRKGKSGDWKNVLSDAHVKKIDEWTKKNVQEFGPDFKYYM